MSEETRRVLDLLAQGKVTVDEAQVLLSAVNDASVHSSSPAQDAADRPKPKWMRIAIHQAAKDGRRDKDVNIRLPIALIRNGMRLGGLISSLAGEQMAARMRERGLDTDFSKLEAVDMDAMLKDLGDSNIEFESGKAQVRITTE